jgi:hypothetical protein
LCRRNWLLTLEILNEYKTNGREASEELINTGKGKLLA